MPGYILHLVQAEEICRVLREQGTDRGEEWHTLFHLGSLLPDTRRKTQKQTSHFWRPQDLHKLAISPDMTLFEEKYGSQMGSAAMLGYWAHLYMDRQFVEKYWREHFLFLDAAGRETEARSEIRRVRLQGRDEEISVEDFFSSSYYYGDYSRMNRYFMDKYSLTVPEYREIEGFPVTEVETEQLHDVLTELANIAAERERDARDSLTVFSLQELESFVLETAAEVVSMAREKGWI